MTPILEEKLSNRTPKWLLILISAVVGSGALWFAWFRYSIVVNRPEFNLYNWIQLAAIILVGILCLSATSLFILGKSSGGSVLKTGLSIIPLLLFLNLIILVFRVVQSIFQGNALSFISRFYVSPLNKAILVLVVIIILSSVIKAIEKK